MGIRKPKQCTNQNPLENASVSLATIIKSQQGCMTHNCSGQYRTHTEVGSVIRKYNEWLYPCTYFFVLKHWHQKFSVNWSEYARSRHIRK